MEAKELRERLITALKEKKTNYGEILSLSAELAQHDQDNVRFTIDAGLVSRLGEELVSRQETAVSEIVKNAYDADATEVTLTFSGTEQIGGRLIVKDNGNGMSRAQLINGFMRLASPDKTLEPKSPIYKRVRAGKKGIGRFAVQRLGKELTLITQTAGEKRALKVEIDWRRFQKEHDLGSIAHKIQYVPASEAGTVIVIDNLREAWSEQGMSRAYRFTEELLQPFSLDPVKITEKTISNSTSDPGFRVTFYKSDGIKNVEVAGEQTMLFEHSVGFMNASVDEDGLGTWNLKSKKLKIDSKGNRVTSISNVDQSYKFLKNVRLQAHYFIYDKELIPSALIPSLQTLGKNRGGIRLYRNGFRVLPYGERGNDWLELDEDQAKRVVLPALGNQYWFGFVEVHDLEGTLFEETASREGLLETAAFEELKAFASDALKAVTLRIASARGRKGLAGQKGFVSRRPRKSPADTMRQAAATMKEVAEQGGGSGENAEAPTVDPQVRDELLKQAEDLTRAAAESEELLQEVTFLRILSSLGLSIGEFSHEIRTVLSSMTSGLVLLSESPELTAETSETLSEVSSEFTKLESYVSYYDKTISASVRRQLTVQNLSKVAYDFWETFEPVAQKNGVELCEPFVEKQEILTKAMHASEWTSILVNLFSNAIKAIRRAKRIGQGRIQISVSLIGDMAILDFSDNGDGIPKENADQIFTAFFTTSGSQADLNTVHDEFIGTGLGLKIVSDILQSNGGEISILEPAPIGYQTCLRVAVPASI